MPPGKPRTSATTRRHRAAFCVHCDWETTVSSGPAVSLPSHTGVHGDLVRARVSRERSAVAGDACLTIGRDCKRPSPRSIAAFRDSTVFQVCLSIRLAVSRPPGHVRDLSGNDEASFPTQARALRSTTDDEKTKVAA